MNTFLALLPLLVAIMLLVSWIASRPRGRQLTALANVAEGFYHGKKTYYTDAAHALRYLLVKPGSDVQHVAIAGATDIPSGICTDEAAAAETLVNVDLLGSAEQTKIGVASAEINVGDFLVVATGGKLKTLPAATGTYYIIGRALSYAAADTNPVEFDPCFPIQRVVA